MHTYIRDVPMGTHLAGANAADAVQRRTHRVGRAGARVAAVRRAAGSRAALLAAVTERAIGCPDSAVEDTERVVAPFAELRHGQRVLTK